MIYKANDVMENARTYSYSQTVYLIFIAGLFLLIFYASAIVKWAENLPVNDNTDKILTITNYWHKTTKEINADFLQKNVQEFFGLIHKEK